MFGKEEVTHTGTGERDSGGFQPEILLSLLLFWTATFWENPLLTALSKTKTDYTSLPCVVMVVYSEESLSSCLFVTS